MSNCCIWRSYIVVNVYLLSNYSMRYFVEWFIVTHDYWFSEWPASSIFNCCQAVEKHGSWHCFWICYCIIWRGDMCWSFNRCNWWNQGAGVWPNLGSRIDIKFSSLLMLRIAAPKKLSVIFTLSHVFEVTIHSWLLNFDTICDQLICVKYLNGFPLVLNPDDWNIISL